MSIHQVIIDSLSKQLQSDTYNIAFFVTGSVARGEATDTSDLDLLLVTKETTGFEEKVIDGIVVEIKSNTLDGFTAKMDENPINIYQWLDAHVVFEREETLTKLQEHAQKVLSSYTPPEIPRKWLDSTKIKILASKEKHDDLSLGFQTSNILWKIVEGLYILNSQPLPPSTTAFRRITTLSKLPDNFTQTWEDALIADLQTRADATLKLIEFLLI